MPDLLILIISLLSLIFGFFAAYFLMRNILESKSKLALEKWKLSAENEIKNNVLLRSRHILKGKIAEQMASFLPEFKHNPADARFIGNPIDYIIFDGYSESHLEEGEKINITFLDIKKGQHAKLNKQQKKIKEAVDSKRIKWETLKLE